jgi:hypothetical protein
MATFFLNPIWKKGTEGLNKGLEGAEATWASLSFPAGMAGAEGFFEGGVSDFGGLTPFMVSIPSTVTVLPSGSFSTFSSLLFPIKGRFAQEVIRNVRAVKKRKRLKRFFRFSIMGFPFLIVMVLYYQFL